jgi:xanthine dehydrogenase accessory factor
MIRCTRGFPRIARSYCAIVEPVLPHPSLIILGASPVAISLAGQARQLRYHVTVAAPAADLLTAPDADLLIDGYRLGPLNESRRFIVVSTQGKGDEAALRIVVTTDAAYHAFVGSRRKMAALREKLIAEGVAANALDRIKAPAGLDLGANHPRGNRDVDFGRNHCRATTRPARRCREWDDIRPA